MNDYVFYVTLNEEESVKYASQAVNDITDEGQLTDVLLRLALFTNGNCLKPHYPKLLNREIFYPSEIYIHADENIADAIIRLIEKGSNYVNHLLCCLAWIGTPNVIEFFLKTSVEKPKWIEKLYVLPREYAYEAGWFIDNSKEKQILINREVIVFSRQDFDNELELETKTFIENKIVCKFCSNNLTTVFEYKIDTNQIPFTACLLCSVYNPFFMTIDSQGESYWHNANTKWEHLEQFGFEIDKIRENTLVVSDETRKAEFTISQFVEITKSQIGGYPTWIQDADYLNCPNCGQKMYYIGQVDMEDVIDFSEGIFYFHYCKKCKITGTNYQQT